MSVVYIMAFAQQYVQMGIIVLSKYHDSSQQRIEGAVPKLNTNCSYFLIHCSLYSISNTFR